MKKAALALALALPLAAACQAGQGATPQDLAVLAATCFTCHGPNGQPPGNRPGSIPGLRGRSAGFLLQRLREFKAMGLERAGADATIMPLLLQGYDEVQIEALAQWFARKEQP